MRPSLRSLAIVGIVAGSAAFAASHQEADPAVEARQSHMGLYAFNLGQLGGMAKGEIEYDAAAAEAAAGNLVALSGIDQRAYWPDGTSTDDIEGTRALPALFDNFDKYKKLLGDLHAASLAMQDVAGESAEAIGGQMRALGGACGACHEDFRAKEDE